MHHALLSLYHYVHANRQSILIYLGAGGGVSLAVKFITRFKTWEQAHPAVKEAIVAFVSGLTALTNWVINNYSGSPLASLGNVGPRIFLAAVAMHRVLVNPIWNTLAKWLKPYMAAVKMLKAETATPVVPVAAVEAPEQFPL